METKHTKGEWLISSSFLIVDKEARIIANCTPVHVRSLSMPMLERTANTKLIAAAPDMLEAIHNAMNIADLWAPDYSKDQTKEEHIGELAALSMMRQEFEKSNRKSN